MGWNLIAAVEQEEDGGIVRPMILTRVHAGITHSATIAKGDHISFDGVEGEIIQISHDHEYSGSEKSPNSRAVINFGKQLSDYEIKLLIKHGWRDLG